VSAEGTLWEIATEVAVSGIDFSDADVARINHEIERRFGGLVTRSPEGLSVRALVRVPAERDAWDAALRLFQPGLVYELPGVTPGNWFPSPRSASGSRQPRNHLSNQEPPLLRRSGRGTGNQRMPPIHPAGKDRRRSSLTPLLTPVPDAS